MRRLVILLAALALALSVAPVAQATHCNPTNPTGCPEPLTLIAVEGIGNVCSKAVLTPAEVATYGSKCTYAANDPAWVSRAQSPWNQSGYTNGSKYQGLFWPGVGPGANGQYSLRISQAASPPNNVCVSSAGGPGCSYDSVGTLNSGQVSGFGAHCGSSRSVGAVKFRSADGSLIMEGSINWDQSAATNLPLHGEIVKITRGGAVQTYPAGSRPQVAGMINARGLGGSGNCGITDPTTGFQVEGFTVTY